MDDFIPEEQEMDYPGPSDISIELGPDAEEGEDVIWAKNSPKPHQWVIKRHSEGEQSYMLVLPRPLI